MIEKLKNFIDSSILVPYDKDLWLRFVTHLDEETASDIFLAVQNTDDFAFLTKNLQEKNSALSAEHGSHWQEIIEFFNLFVFYG